MHHARENVRSFDLGLDLIFAQRVYDDVRDLCDPRWIGVDARQIVKHHDLVEKEEAN